MTKPLSAELRERVVAAVDGGLSRRKAAERSGGGSRLLPWPLAAHDGEAPHLWDRTGLPKK